MSEETETNDGYIYIIFNDMYQLYGEGVYKVGKTSDITKRLAGFTTCYIKPVELKFLSEKCINYHLAEKMIFIALREWRITANREFFKTDLENIIKVIEEVVSGINNNDLTIDAYERGKTASLPPARIHLTPEERKQKKIEVAQQIISDVGLNNVDNVHRDELKEKLAYVFHEGVLKDIEDVRRLFSVERMTTNHIFECESIRSKLGLLNTILAIIGKRISNCSKNDNVKSHRRNYYKLEDRNDSLLLRSEPEEIITSST